MAKKAKTYHHPDLKNALLQEALLFIKDHKHDALSLRDLARRIGVSHSAPHRHFPDKESLYAALIQHGFEEMRKKFDLIHNKNLSFHDEFYYLGYDYINFVIENPELSRLMFGGFLCKTGEYPEAEKAGENAFQSLIEMIIRGQTEGHLKTSDPFQVSFMVWSTVHGFASLVIEKHLEHFEPTMDQKQSLQTMIEFISKSLLSGLQK